MDDHTNTPIPNPSPRPRRKRPNGRWSNPATPLQAARFEKRASGREVITAIRQLCPGHSGEPCRIDVAKLSDYETGNRRPGLTHIEAFCRYYQRSPEALGLIKWRDDPEPEPSDAPPAATPNPAQTPVLVILIHALAHTTASTVVSEVLQALSHRQPNFATPPTPAPATSEEDDSEPDSGEP